MTVRKKNIWHSSYLLFLGAFLYNKQKDQISSFVMLNILRANPLQIFCGLFIITNLKKLF